MLAVAGLKRLGLMSAATAVLEIDEFLPAVGQGAIGLETRADDDATRALVAKVNDPIPRPRSPPNVHIWPNSTAPAARRSPAMRASSTASSAFAASSPSRTAAKRMRLRARVRAGDAAALGADAGRELKKRAGPDFFVRI